MNVSATRLVYVNKGSAKIKNEDTGDFVNAVDNGIEIETGDTISIEGIAVESRGVGANIIEIPSRELDYPYLTNKMSLNMWYYIHHNCEYTIIQPTTKTQFSNTTDKTSLKYGYARSGTGWSVEDMFPPISADRAYSLNEYPNSYLSGTRYYIGAFSATVENVTNPIFYNTQEEADNGILPSNSDFNFIECNRQINCNLGYDSPANIASQITANFHRGRFTPNINLFFNGQDRAGFNGVNYQPNKWINPLVSGGQPDAGITGDIDECVATIRAIPYSFENTSGVVGSEFYSFYQGLLGVVNPFYYYYGSRLLNVNRNNKIDLRTLWAGAYSQGDIYLLNTITYDDSISLSKPQQGELFVMNLKWTKENLINLRGLIHSQKNYVYGTRATTKELDNQTNKNQFQYNIPLGRYVDTGVPPNPDPYDDRVALPQPFNTAESIRPAYATTMCFYNKAFYEESGYILKGDTSYPFQNSYEVGDGGLLEGLSPKGWSQKLDINVFAVEVPTSLTERDWVIAIPLLGLSFPRSAIGNYALVDFTLSRKEATCVSIITSKMGKNDPEPITQTYANIMKCMSIGSPDMTMSFDDQRGRFALKNMYWAKRIGNDKEAGNPDPDIGTPLNPDPEQEVIIVNKVQQGFFTLVNGVAYVEYAQSGLGLVNISVLDEEENAYRIDKYDPQDIEAKYNGSLLERLGFTFQGLINMNGRPEVYFQEQYYNTLEKTKYATMFPYPLTNNPEIDTTFNQYLSQNNYSAPIFSLDTERDRNDINVSCSSAFIYAENLPRKLASPYWIIASDIIDGVKFVKDGIPVNCLAVCNRSYISGDFAFSFATDYKFKADIPFTLSSIKTKVLTQDLLPADIDNGTSIIYKIEKAYQSLQVEEEEEAQQNTKTKSK